MFDDMTMNIITELGEPSFFYQCVFFFALARQNHAANLHQKVPFTAITIHIMTQTESEKKWLAQVKSQSTICRNQLALWGLVLARASNASLMVAAWAAAAMAAVVAPMAVYCVIECTLKCFDKHIHTHTHFRRNREKAHFADNSIIYVIEYNILITCITC